MQRFAEFIGRSLMSAIGNTTVGTVLLVLGLTPEAILAASLHPPWWVLYPATRVGFVITAMLLWAWLMWTQSRAEISIPDALMRRKSLNFANIADELSHVSALGLTRSQLMHTLLKAFWNGEFESRAGNSSLWLLGASTHRLVGGESIPVSGPTIDNESGERMDTDMLVHEPTIEANRRYMLQCELGLRHLYPNLAVVLQINGNRPWRETKNDINFELLGAIRPEQYDQDYIHTYIERVNMRRGDFVRWFKRLRDGRYDM